jgi:hypothetical protein
MQKARTLCDHDSLHRELEFLKDTLKQNGYSNQQIHWALEEVVDTMTKQGTEALLMELSLPVRL